MRSLPHRLASRRKVTELRHTRPMDLELGGKHVLVTGGSRGIGLACARLFVREGARVTIVGRTQAHLDAARESLRAQGAGDVTCLAADLTDAAAAASMLERAVAAQGDVDVLVNSAGAAKRTPFPELTPEAWHAAMQAKFFTYIHVIDPLVKRMGERGTGVIVNVIGSGGKVATTTHLAGGAANAALMLATAGLAAAWAPKGVRVNAVNPAATLTDRMEQGLEAEARLRGVTSDEVLKQLTAKAPLGRLATPEEIANAVVFLASPRSSHVTGAILSMDGAVVPSVV
jgi:NAD(P)-dependent dehydrogenase (short-subunit alcohol dehydrogenase family)